MSVCSVGGGGFATGVVAASFCPPLVQVPIGFGPAHTLDSVSSAPRRTCVRSCSLTSLSSPMARPVRALTLPQAGLAVGHASPAASARLSQRVTYRDMGEHGVAVRGMARHSYLASPAFVPPSRSPLPRCSSPSPRPRSASSSGALGIELSLQSSSPMRRIAISDLVFLDSLGVGEFGQVFRGIHAGKEVAIKRLNWDASLGFSQQGVMDDLVREIELLRRLRHKRLIGFIGASLEPPDLYFVMEYAPGGSLYHMLHVQKVKLPSGRSANMCLQLADAVRYLHSQSPCVVHRDLKSLNVVLDHSLNIKLCDFGLAEVLERSQPVVKGQTGQGHGGSPRYMAPELFEKSSCITEKVDIWSMGCILAEILGGPLPYEGVNTLPDLTRDMLIRKMPPVAIHSLLEGFGVCVRSCHRFDPWQRPSAQVVYDQLLDAKWRLPRRLSPENGQGLPDRSNIEEEGIELVEETRSAVQRCAGSCDAIGAMYDAKASEIRASWAQRAALRRASASRSVLAAHGGA